MSFEIRKNGIASVDFTISLDSNSTTVRMTQPWEDKQEFSIERNRIANIFGATMLSTNTVEVNHGSYSEKTITNLRKVVDTLNEKSFIDLQRHDKIIQRLEEMVAQVKIEYEREIAQFASLLSSFKTNVGDPYKDFYDSDDMLVDESIVQLRYLISQVCGYHGNPMKVGSRWIFLFVCEGALEHLIKSLNNQEQNNSKDRLVALHLGVVNFLQQYEKELHIVIEKTITKSPNWHQQLYADYKSMVKTGETPNKNCYGPITNSDLWGKTQLYLPSRFDMKAITK